jgi:hypothetical protein
MVFIATCPKCGARYKNVPDEVEGGSFACKRCSGKFVLERIAQQEKRATDADGEVLHRQPGDVIGSLYKVTAQFRAGGFGVVYKVNHLGWNMKKE